MASPSSKRGRTRERLRACRGSWEPAAVQFRVKCRPTTSNSPRVRFAHVGPLFEEGENNPAIHWGPLLPFLLLAFLILAGCGPKEPKAPVATADNSLQRVAEKGPVKMTVRVWPRDGRLSDRLSMEIVIESEPGVEITPPSFGSSVGEFVVRDYNDTSAKPDPKAPGKHVRTLSYQLEPAFAGMHLIRSVALEFTDKRPGTEAKPELVLIETDPIEIEVTSEWGGKTPSLGDLSAMQPPRPLSPNPIWKWIYLAVALVLVAGVALYLRSRYRQHIEELLKPPTPEEVASRELKDLLSANLHGQQQYQEFYVRLTGIVRRYIESTTGLRAPEQTTEEFLRDMREKNVFPAERSAQLVRFLESADLVKYAAQRPGEKEIEDAIARAREFVTPKARATQTAAQPVAPR